MVPVPRCRSERWRASVPPRPAGPLTSPREGRLPVLPSTDHTALPALALDAEWKAQPRLWGHPFHPMCSYLGSFPAALAHAFISRLSRPGDVVIDPFSGRGTVPLQACIGRRIGVGIDANPLAWLLTAAKVDPPDARHTAARLDGLRIDWSIQGAEWMAMVRAAARDPERSLVPAAAGTGRALEPLPRHVLGAFHERTLARLLLVRHALDPTERIDRFMLAALTGMLHGRSAGYLSTSMPNAFSLAPGYTRRFVAARERASPDRDVFRLLSAKLTRLYRHGIPPGRGLAIQGQAREAGMHISGLVRHGRLPHAARLVVTSPPYLRVLRYGSYNWLRLWLLGHDAAAVDAALALPARQDEYAAFLRAVLGGLRDCLADDAAVVLVLGCVTSDGGRAVRRERDLAQLVWERAAEPEGYTLAGVSADAVAARRKLTRMWGPEAGRATDTDRILVIAPTESGRRRALAALGTPIDWAHPAGRRGATILGRHAADVSPGRPGGHGSARPDEESRPRSHDQPAPELHPSAAGPPIRP